MILDRSFDFLSPLLHDYFYESTLYDFFDVGEEGDILLASGPKPKSVVLNDQDDLWVRFRDKHIAEVNQKLNEEIAGVLAENKRMMGGSRSADELGIDELTKIIRSNPKYEEMMKRYQLHLELINKSMTDFNQLNLRKLIQLEQDIITGLTGSGSKVSNT